MALLPVATSELLDNMVNLPWWLFFAAFWAFLWRPQTAAGRVVAGAVCFLATASEPLVALFVPLAVVRALVLRPLREHAAAAGAGVGPGLRRHRPPGVRGQALHPGRARAASARTTPSASGCPCSAG